MVPTIVTAHTFCAFRDFPCGTRDAWVNFNLLLQCSFATFAFALSTYTGSNGQEKKTQQEIQLYQKQVKRSFFNGVWKKWKTLGKSDEKERDSAGWRDGRIVEIGFLADQLTEGCSECKTKLNLTNIVDEMLQGLGSVLYIQWEDCYQVNAIKTPKTHRSPGKKRVGCPI